MLAVVAVRSVPEVSAIHPPVAVINTAALGLAPVTTAWVLPVTRALAPKLTLRPAENVKEPSSELTVEAILISLVDVIVIVPVLVVVTGPLILIVPAEVVKAMAFAVSVTPDDPIIKLPVAAV